MTTSIFMEISLRSTATRRRLDVHIYVRSDKN